MTIVEVKREEGSITYVRASGHTDFAVHGEDIVCAGISSIIQTAILGVKNILKVDIMSTRDDGIIEIVVPQELDSKKKADIQIILETMLCGLKDLGSSYPNNINIKEI